MKKIDLEKKIYELEVIIDKLVEKIEKIEKPVKKFDYKYDQTKRMKQVYELILTRPGITTKQLSDNIGISTKNVSSNIYYLRNGCKWGLKYNIPIATIGTKYQLMGRIPFVPALRS